MSVTFVVFFLIGSLRRYAKGCLLVVVVRFATRVVSRVLVISFCQYMVVLTAIWRRFLLVALAYWLSSVRCVLIVYQVFGIRELALYPLVMKVMFVIIVKNLIRCIHVFV